MTNPLFIDADDTLWGNEHKFRDAQQDFLQLIEAKRLEHGLPPIGITKSFNILNGYIEKNIPEFGYGSRSMLLSMIEASYELLGTDSLDKQTYNALTEIYRQVSDPNVEPFEGVEQTLRALSKKRRLILATKGDLREQMQKIRNSGLEKYFSHIHVMTDKRPEDYLQLCSLMNILPQQMIMIGNSVRSDIVPVLELGGKAIYIPHHIVWTHEACEVPKSKNLITMNKFSDLARFWHLDLTE